MRRRPYSGPPMASREGTAGLRARLARAAAAGYRVTHEAALQIVRDLLTVAQKLHSNTLETLDAAVAASLSPWVCGDKDIRPLLIEIDQGAKPLEPLGLFNLMSVAWRLEPALAVLAPLLLPEGRDLPEPDTAWLGGWEAAA